MMFFLQGIGDCIIIGVVYFGPGFLISRFLTPSFRQDPALWGFLTIVALPLIVVPASFLHSVSPWTVVIAAFGCLVAGIMLSFSRLPSFDVFPWPEVPVSGRDRMYCGMLLIAFVVMLILAKLPLLAHSTLYLTDDIGRVRLLVSSAFDLGHPLDYNAPWQSASYYFFYWLAPASVLGTTHLDAQLTWFIHGLFAYAAMAAVLYHFSLRFFTSLPSRLFFLFLCTLFASHTSSLESWLNFLGWNNLVVAMRPRDMFFTFLENPHHSFAAILFLVILLIRLGRPSMFRHLLVAILAGILFGLSTLVFLSAGAALVVLELYEFIRSRPRMPDYLRLCAQAVVFFLIVSPLVIQYAVQRRAVFFQPRLLAMPHLGSGASFSVLQIVVCFGIFCLLLSTVTVFAAVGATFVEIGKKKKFLQSCVVSIFIAVLATALSGSMLGQWSVVRGRPLLPAIFLLFLFASLGLEKLRMSKLRHSWLSSILMFVVLFHAYPTVMLFRQMIAYTPRPADAVFEAIRSVTPRNSLLFIGNDVLKKQPNFCEHVTFSGNRLCAAARDRNRMGHRFDGATFFLTQRQAERRPFVAYSDGYWLYRGLPSDQ